MVVKKLFKFLAFFVSFQSDDPLDVPGIDLEIISSETFHGKCYPEIALVQVQNFIGTEVVNLVILADDRVLFRFEMDKF